MAALANKDPENMALRGIARQYAQTRLALGLTQDMRNTAIYHSATLAFKQISGEEWSGNP